MSKDYVDQLERIVRAKKDRAEAIDRRMDEIDKMDFSIMTVAQLQETQEEVKDLLKEIRELKAWLGNAKHELALWYAPAMMIA